MIGYRLHLFNFKRVKKLKRLIVTRKWKRVLFVSYFYPFACILYICSAFYTASSVSASSHSFSIILGFGLGIRMANISKLS